MKHYDLSTTDAAPPILVCCYSVIIFLFFLVLWLYTLMCNCVSIYANEAELGRFQIKAAAPPHQQIPNISHNKKIAGGLCYSLFLKFIFYYVVAGMFKTSPAHSFGAYSSCFISIVSPPPQLSLNIIHILAALLWVIHVRRSTDRTRLNRGTYHSASITTYVRSCWFTTGIENV